MGAHIASRGFVMRRQPWIAGSSRRQPPPRSGDLNRREPPPVRAVGDGAVGFWEAVRDRGSRCGRLRDVQCDVL